MFLYESWLKNSSFFHPSVKKTMIPLENGGTSRKKYGDVMYSLTRIPKREPKDRW
jgi:hypothetical protein